VFHHRPSFGSELSQAKEAEDGDDDDDETDQVDKVVHGGTSLQREGMKGEAANYGYI
jgi:hypothetical protein